MTGRRYALIFLICALLFGSAVFAVAQETVRLELKFKPGELLRYKMVMNMNISMEASGPSTAQIPNLPMRMVMMMRQRTKRILPNGSAQVNAVVDSMKLTMVNKTQDIPVKKMPCMTVVIGPSGRVESVTGLEKLTAASNGMPFVNPWSMQQYCGLPSNELIVGESWSQSLPFPMGGNVSVIGTLVSASEVLGKSKVAVVKQDIYGDLDFANLAQSFSGQQVPIPSGLKMKGKINGSGTTYFSTEKGQMMRTDGWADIQMALDVPASSQGGQSGSMSMKMRMDFEVFLLP